MVNYTGGHPKPRRGTKGGRGKAPPPAKPHRGHPAGEAGKGAQAPPTQPGRGKDNKTESKVRPLIVLVVVLLALAHLI